MHHMFMCAQGCSNFDLRFKRESLDSRLESLDSRLETTMWPNNCTAPIYGGACVPPAGKPVLATQCLWTPCGSSTSLFATGLSPPATDPQATGSAQVQEYKEAPQKRAIIAPAGPNKKIQLNMASLQAKLKDAMTQTWLDIVQHLGPDSQLWVKTKDSLWHEELCCKVLENTAGSTLQSYIPKIKQFLNHCQILVGPARRNVRTTGLGLPDGPALLQQGQRSHERARADAQKPKISGN